MAAMAAIPNIIGGVGVAAIGSAVALFQQGVHIPAIVLGGLGLGFLGLSLWTTSLPRGEKGRDLNKQSAAMPNTAEWTTELNEEGKSVKVYRGPWRKLGLQLPERAIMDELGLVTACKPSLKTTYDLIFPDVGREQRPALARCVKQHTFKDATLPDGKPNPKPTVIDEPARWETMTHAQMKKEARAFGSCLRSTHKIGLKEKVAIWSGNCPEWVLVDFACAAFNWTSVSVYDTLGPDAASYIVADSGAQVLVCEAKTFKKVPELLKDEVYTSNTGSDLKVVVCIGKKDEATSAALKEAGITVVSFDETLSHNIIEDTPPKSDDIVTLMYTSGTTGMPKGVMLKHINIVATISMIDLTPSLNMHDTDVHLSYLPLAHIFERSIMMGVLNSGGAVYFASQGAKALLADLSIVRPTFFAGVPKVYENVRDAVKRKMTGFKKDLFEKAMADKIKDLETGCGYSRLWDILVFNKTKQALGGRVRFCVSGGAPISKDTLQFVVCALGPIVQGYGATETSAASTLTMAFDLVVGDVGPPLGSSAIRVVDVPDMNYFCGPDSEYDDLAKFAPGQRKNGGEVWIGGPGVSDGYYDPSVSGLKEGVASNGMAKKTKEDFFKEKGWSWFKTGDIGSWTERGCLKIVDRRKNMFKTSLGEYVPVEEVEKTYQDNCPYADFVFLPKETKVAYIALCVVVSDSIGSVMKWAKENGVSGDEKAVVASAEFKKLLIGHFDAAWKEKKLQPFMKVKPANIYVEYQAPGYQENWVAGVVCANGHKEQLLTATFKARRTQLDQYFAPAFKTIYPDRPADHILP